MAEYEADRLGFLLDLRARYGSVVRLGSRSTVLNDPALALEVLRDRSGAFGVREDFLQRRLSHAEMADRLAPRPVLNVALRPSAVQEVATLLENRLVSELSTLRPHPSGFDPLPVLERAFSQALAEFYFGAGAGHIAARVGALLDELGRIIGNPFALPTWAAFTTRRKVEQCYRDVVAVVVPALERRAAAPGRFDDAAARMMASSGRHSTRRIADMLIGALLAGHRVPAAGGAWLLMLLAERPVVQKAIRAELRAGRGHDEGSSDLMRRVVLEGLRLYPPTWMVARTAETAVELGGWHFARGHNFLISPYVIHRDDALFSDAGRFLPDRWRAPVARQTAILTFGAGIHLCPGRSLAQALLRAAVTTIVGSYALGLAPGPVSANPRTTLLPDGLRLRISPLEVSRSGGLPCSAAPAVQPPAAFFARAAPS